MRYFHEDAKLGRVGPYTEEELRQLHLNGRLGADARMIPEGGGDAVPFQEWWARISAQPPPVATAQRSKLDDTWASFSSFTQQAREDLRALTPHLLVPWDEFKSLRWLENRRLLALAGIGLVPLLILAMFGDRGEIRSAYWAIALYFSGLWAVFFYYVFPAPRITVRDSAIAFFGTGVISIALLLMAYRLPPLSWISDWTASRDFIVRWVGYTLAVGIPEEVCKVLVLFILWRKADPHPPQTMLFYGLMAGLGFGIYEGVDYQMGRNLRYSDSIGEYYLLNVLRLTTLPFLHAIWSGIAGYFVGFALLYPVRKRGLFIVAIGLPALLHGTYDAVRSTFASLVLALFSVLALSLYLAKSQDFEKAVAEKSEQPPKL